MNAHEDFNENVWGRSVVRSNADSSSYLIYEHRRRSVSELTRDILRWPSRVCMVQGDRRMSYRELYDSIRVRGETLRKIGVTPGDRVLLLGHNSTDWICAFWAIQVCGGIAVLGNMRWSTHELESALELTTPRVAIVDGRTDVDPRFLTVPLTGTQPTLSSVAPSSGDITANENSVAVIIFTSGTTGAAKGVALSNRSIVANLHNLLLRTNRLPSELPHEHEGTVNLLCLPLFHIGGLQSALATLLSGGRIVFLEGRFDPIAALGVIEKEKVRFWGAVPTMVSRVLEEPTFGKFNTSSVESLTIAGSMVSPELVTRANQAFPRAQRRVGAVYGLTESGGF